MSSFESSINRAWVVLHGHLLHVRTEGASSLVAVECVFHEISWFQLIIIYLTKRKVLKMSSFGCTSHKRSEFDKEKLFGRVYKPWWKPYFSNNVNFSVYLIITYKIITSKASKTFFMTAARASFKPSQKA